MIIDEKSKCIILHNPKCGGTFLHKCYWKGNPDDSDYLFWHLWTPEDNIDRSHITSRLLPRFVPDFKDYKIFTFVRNPYNRFVSAFKTAAHYSPYLRKLLARVSFDPKQFCEYLLNLDYANQDAILRNTRHIWFMPQSEFYNGNVEVLKFESLSDWQYIFNLLSLKASPVIIPEDYAIDQDTREMIKKLYFDDYELFDKYDIDG